jgi:hypothetical protein
LGNQNAFLDRAHAWYSCGAKRIEPLCPKLGGLPGETINCRPARPVRWVRKAPLVLMWCCRCGVACCSGAHGQPGTPARVRGGLGTCHATATCVRDPRPGARPDGTRSSSSVPGCGPTSQPVHGTPADRIGESAKKLLLRDHALPQSQQASVLVAKMWRADGAHVLPRRAGLWRHRADAVVLAASPPASAAPGACIRGPGNNADSNSAAGTCVHSLCAGRRAVAVVGNGSLAYHDDGPRERFLPRDSPG